jgi:hypothetical protein
MATKKAARKKSTSATSGTRKKTASRKKAASKKKGMSTGLKKALGAVLVGAALGATAAAVRAVRKGKGARATGTGSAKASRTPKRATSSR